jgi:8-oxo-dGTP diphosphatase
VKRLYPDQPVVGIGAVIIKEGKIALIKRGNEPRKGKWTIPGGLVELGENLEAAVIRETKEETCLEVENPTLMGVVDNVDLDEQGKVKYHYVIIDYLRHHRLPRSSQNWNYPSCKRCRRATLGSF